MGIPVSILSGYETLSTHPALHLGTSILTDMDLLERGVEESEWGRAILPGVHTYFAVREFRIIMWSSLSVLLVRKRSCVIFKKSFLCLKVVKIFCISF